MLKTSKKLPPNFEEINKVCHPDISKTVFTYGDCVYNVHKPLEDHLEVHEAVHVRQQAGGWFTGNAKKWWQKYLNDKQFRLEQELEAYREQYQFIKKHYPKHASRCLVYFAADLSGPMYGNLLTSFEALEEIKQLDVKKR